MKRGIGRSYLEPTAAPTKPGSGGANPRAGRMEPSPGPAPALVTRRGQQRAALPQPPPSSDLLPTAAQGQPTRPLRQLLCQAAVRGRQAPPQRASPAPAAILPPVSLPP